MEGPKLLVMRHAQSVFNKYTEGNGRRLGDKPPEEFRYQEQFIDTDISPEGLEQAARASVGLKNHPIKVVFTSPLKRCLQTTQAAFKDHPEKPRIIVHPFLRECLFSSCDVPGDLGKLMEEFKEFDWSLFDGYKEKDIWVLETLQNETLRKDLLDELEKNQVRGDATEFHRLLNKKMEESHPIGLESDEDLFKRTMKVKETLKAILKDLKADDKAMMVCHFLFLKVITAEKIEDGKAVGFRMFQNCEYSELLV